MNFSNESFCYRITTFQIRRNKFKRFSIVNEFLCVIWISFWKFFSLLKNLLGIKTQADIEQLEAEELEKIGIELVKIYDEHYQFSVEDISDIHELWLSGIYSFAGKYRTVMMWKDGFPFANPEFIPKLMKNFERDFLKKYTPCYGMDNWELANAIGIVHVELILIHPFREGNGRVARMLANLMALQAGKNMLDYTIIDKTVNEEGYNRYIYAIQEGHRGNYSNIINLFEKILEQTI